MNNMTGFILAGHSFGGYVVGHYAIKYPQHLKKLLMLSPAGVPAKPDGLDLTKMEFGPKKKVPSKFSIMLAKKVWAKKWSPFGVMRKSGKFIGKKMIKSYMSKRMADLPPEEFNAM